jgi:hypothetical protein
MTVPAKVEADKTAESPQKAETKSQKTLLEWSIGKKEAKDDKEKGKDGEEENRGKGKEAADGNSSKAAANDEFRQKDQDEEPKRLDPDRPHLPEASTTVGVGRAVLEAGYTYNTSGGFFPMHSFPEATLRVGVFADWFEFRIGQNLVSQTAIDEFHDRSITIGAEDLQLGFKLALTEQQQYLPESALIVQMTVPSGSKGLTANRVLPGVHYDCSWEVIKDKLSVETVLLADGSVNENGHTFTMLGHGVTAAYDLTKKLEAFGELDSFYAAGDSAPPQHYFVAGLVYFITRDCEIDVRAGVGLNQHADGYLVGSGFAVRY